MKQMSRFTVGLATTFLVAAAMATSVAIAQPDQKKRGAPAAPAAAPRAAPAARPAPPAARPAPAVARPAPAAPRQAPAAVAPRIAPRMAAPPRSAPRIAAPPAQRAAPAARAAERIQRFQQRQQTTRPERRQQAVQRQLNARPAAAAAATTSGLESRQSTRVQQLQSRSRLSRSERRELRTLQRSERRNAQQNAVQPGTPNTQNALTTQQQRIQQLESRRRLSRPERRELGQLRRDERQNAQRQQQQQQQQQQAAPGAAAAAAAASGPPRAQRTQAVTAEQVTRGRFASNLQANAAGVNGRRAGRRAAQLASRVAWQLGLLAPYVPWRGPVYWPYAYNDMFYYTFWPDAYDPGYWAYAYDDFFDGVFFPDGAPHVAYEAEGPYAAPYGRTTTGSAPSTAASPGRVTQAMRDFCADQAKGATAWPLDRIADTVQPNEQQKALLEDLRSASEQAAADFKDACPDSVPMTPIGRLQAMIQRLQATDRAVQTVKPALEAFYNSLSDEQKARFNEIGPSLAASRQRPARNIASASQADCSSDKAGLSNLAANRIEQTVRPTEAQGAALDKLDEAVQKAVNDLRDACPNTTPLTPVGRLDVMQQRIEALIAAASTVRPALEEFYAALSDEQKARFNRLGRQSAQSDN
jgi:hypothetical protein